MLWYVIWIVSLMLAFAGGYLLAACLSLHHIAKADARAKTAEQHEADMRRWCGANEIADAAAQADMEQARDDSVDL